MTRLFLRRLPVRFGLCALLATVLAQAPDARAQQGPQTPPVDVAVPLQAEVTDHDIYTGRFEAVDRVELRARVSGYLESVGFEDGAIVEKGQLLFTIDRRPFEAVVARAEAAVAAARAAADLAEIELERAAQLARRNVGTEQEVDRARATLVQANAELAVAEAELRSARLDLDFTEIRAPFTGRVSDRRVDPGNLVVGGASQATLLTTLVRTDPLFFTFTTSEADYLRYRRLTPGGDTHQTGGSGTPIAVRLMDETEFVHEGVMSFLDNEIDPNSGTIAGRARIENPDDLIVPGVFGRMKMPASEPYQALLVPDDAILSDQANKIVLTVDGEGKVAQSVVTLGPLRGALRVIRDGIEPDTRVIVAGVQRARPGQTVEPNEVTLEMKGE